GGNKTSVIKSKIDDALKHLSEGKKVVVCCDYGISRSNAVAVGILSVQEGINIDEAIRHVVSKTGEKSIKIDLLSSVRQTLTKNKKKEKSQRKNLKKSNILITGASGFIGKSLTPKLKRKYNLIIPTRNKLDLVNDTIELDLTAKKNQVNTIVHLANPRIYTTNESMGQALVMLKNVLDVCKENKLFLLYVSGWEVYSGHKGIKHKVNETFERLSGGTYGHTKLLCELLIETYNKQYGIKYTIIRSSPVYGTESDRPKFIRNFLDKAFNNTEITTHKFINGYPVLDLLHIDDFITALVSAIKYKIRGSINIGSGRGITTNYIAHLIVNKLNSKSTIRHVEINDYASNIIMDTKYAKNVLKWKPRIDAESGLERIIRSEILKRKLERQNTL
ncbi:MAG: NAD-dependent epimerase/dehydratase family protein, partial [Patescibacteria group bacterium]|nr:NAD-dependent epimerase/dehydratase family protein [Patescibacteria group bacterium]